MFKFTCIVLAVLIATAAAKPGIIAPVAYSAPLLAAAPAVVTATSSQVVARNYNGLAAPIVAAPVAYSAPLAYTAPIAPFAAAPIARYAAAPIARYAAAPIARYAAAPLAYSAYAAPFSYPAGPVLL